MWLVWWVAVVSLHCSVGWVLFVCGEVSAFLVPESAMPTVWLLGNDGSKVGAGLLTKENHCYLVGPPQEQARYDV